MPGSGSSSSKPDDPKKRNPMGKDALDRIKKSGTGDKKFVDRAEKAANKNTDKGGKGGGSGGSAKK